MVDRERGVFAPGYLDFNQLDDDIETFEQMIGKTMSSVVVSDDKSKMVFTEIDGINTPGGKHTFFHESDCCEVVRALRRSLVISPISNGIPLLGPRRYHRRKPMRKDFHIPIQSLGTDEAEDNGNQCSYTWTFIASQLPRERLSFVGWARAMDIIPNGQNMKAQIKTDEDNDY